MRLFESLTYGKIGLVILKGRFMGKADSAPEKQKLKIGTRALAISVLAIALASLLTIRWIRSQREKKNPVFNWSNLSLELRTEKTQYLQAEPIRATTIIRNKSDTELTLRYEPEDRAALISYCRVLPDGHLAKVLEMKYPRVIFGGCLARPRFWGIFGRWSDEPIDFTIEPNSFCVVNPWLNASINKASFEPGETTFRAIFKPLAGEHRGKELHSNDVTIAILNPQGRDAEAYKFMTRRNAVDVGGGRKFGPGFVMYGGLFHQAGSHHGRPVHEYFVRNYGDSLYANYVRYTLAMGSHHRDPNGFVGMMSELISRAPRDFPLLPDAYAHLLRYCKEQGHADKVAALCPTIKLEELPIVNPDLAKEITGLIDYFAELEQRASLGGTDGTMLLLEAARRGHIGTVKFLLGKGADVNAKDSYGQTALYLAAKQGHKEVVELLMDNGADVNIENKVGRTALFWAVSNGHRKIVEILIANGAKVNVKENSGRTPLEWAMGNHKWDIAKLLIANGADVDAKGDLGRSGLHLVAIVGNEEVAELLLREGADVNARDNDGKTPLAIAIELGHEGLAELLRKHGGVE